MNRYLYAIKKADIFAAIRKVDSEQISEDQYLGYQLIYSSKFYSPRQIVEIAYEISTRKSDIYVYNIRVILDFLTDMGFSITMNSKVWKLGCNWGSSSPSFYSLLTENNIVICSNYTGEFKPNDLILITEGFTVRALARVIRRKGLVSENYRLLQEFNKYNVHNPKEVTIYESEIYELNSLEIFKYKLQQGIVQVRQIEIFVKAINIWNDRNLHLEDFGFTKGFKSYELSADLEFPIFQLAPDNWNDYGYYTSFNLYFAKSPIDKIDIGEIKIFQKGCTITKIPDEFVQLDDSFCSLGQTFEFYNNLMNLFPNQFKQILIALRDMGTNSSIQALFEEEEGVQKSLLRSSETYAILKRFNQSFENTLDFKCNFQYFIHLENVTKEHRVHFNFSSIDSLEVRLYAIIGKNATGKTQFLSHLVNKLVDNNESGIFEPERPSFAKIISASFSYFDNFRFPKRNDVSYEFIGIKDGKGLIEEEKYMTIVWESYQNVMLDEFKKQVWLDAIVSSLESDYLNFELTELITVQNKSEFKKRTSDIFSSGQNIIFQFITRFIENIEKYSLLVFDEPETHLHPNIAGRLVRTINRILLQFKSYGILSTHSPVIVQEIPSQYIRIFNRQDNSPIIFIPPQECFGENLTEISNSIFKVNEEEELYKEQLKKLVDSNLSLDQINALFQNNLSLNARLYLKSITG